MDLLNQSYQAHFFCDNSDIQAIPQVLSQLLTHLGGFGVMPTFGTAINARTAEKRQFVIMLSTDEKLRIEFPNDRIIIASENKTIEEFTSLVSPIMEKLTQLFSHKQANRISIVSSNIYIGNDEEYNKLYEHLFTYKQVKPFEWDNRIVIQEEICSEKVNVVNTIRRCEVSASYINDGLATNIILVEVDVNSSPRLMAPRFPIAQSPNFFQSYIEVNQQHMNKLNRYFN